MRPNRPVYLDNQATTACDPRVLAVMLPYFTEQYGNPHSVEHAMGRAAEDAVETARAHIAAAIGAEPREIVLTSGATESNNIAIKGAARFAASRETARHRMVGETARHRMVGETARFAASRETARHRMVGETARHRMVGETARHRMVQDTTRRRVITLATEHKCVLESVSDLAAEGFEPIILPVRPDGLLDPDTLREALATPTLLVSIMAVNNETGVIQDLATLAPLVKQAGALLHTDAAQAVGKIPLDVHALSIDLLSISGHKIYGPKGVGALYVRRRPRARLAPLFSGGGQERGLRSGTLPTPLIVGLGEACRLAAADLASDAARIATLRQRLLDQLAIPDLRINGTWDARIPGNLNLTFPHATAADLMTRSPDLCVSTGSACSSAELEPSYVLRAMGLSDAEAARTLRIGIGRFTSAADVDFAAQALRDAHATVEA